MLLPSPGAKAQSLVLLLLVFQILVGENLVSSAKTIITVRSINGDEFDGDSGGGGGGGENGRAASLVLAPAPAPAASSASGSSVGEKPRLIPLVASDSGYSENSSVNILCTVSQGHHESLTFDWFKEGQSIASLAAADSLLQIESQPDHSLLRVSRVKSHHSGRYTCSAKNQFGQDSSSVNLAVNGNYPSSI